MMEPVGHDDPTHLAEGIEGRAYAVRRRAGAVNPEGTIREANDGRLRSQANTAVPYRTLGDPDEAWHHDFEDARAGHLRDLGDHDGLCIRAFQSAKSPPMPANLQNDFSWDDVRIFLALFRARTLSSAAVRLGVNASTVGRRLDALEGALGARLFDRTPDGVAPTAPAEELAPHAEALERTAAGFAMAAAGREAEVEGTVRITAVPGVAEDLLAPALP